MIRLTETKRQEGADNNFKDLLTRLSGGGPLEDRHYELMKSRSYKNLEEEEKKQFWTKAKYICALNMDLVPFNIERYEALNTPVAVVQAVNTGKGSSTADPDTAGGLLNHIILAVGGKVVLKSKLWQDAGLVNGAQGVVKRILYKPGNAPPQLPDCVLVHFEHYEGPPLIESEPKLIPITPVTTTWTHYKNECSRTQIPCVPGDATTIHVTQGDTLDKAIINLGIKEFACGITYTGISRVRSLKDLVFYPDAPTKMRMKFMENKPFREKKYEDERLERLEEKFLNEVLVNIPKPNYNNEDEEDVMDVDMVQLKKSQIRQVLDLIKNHDQFKLLATWQTDVPTGIFKELEKLQTMSLKKLLEQQELPILIDIAKSFNVIGISGTKPQKQNVVDKTIAFILNQNPEDQRYHLKMIRSYLRYVKILLETDGKLLEKEHQRKSKNECKAFASEKGLNLKKSSSLADMRNQLVMLQLAQTANCNTFFRQIEEMKTQITERYSNTTNQSPGTLGSTILASILSTSDFEITTNLDGQKTKQQKKTLVKDKIDKAERPELEDALKYLLGLSVVPSCLEDSEISSFLLKYPEYSYIFFYADDREDWKKPIYQCT